MTPAFLRPSQVAPLLGVDQRTVRRWVEDGTIPAAAVQRIGRSKTAKRIRLKLAVLRELKLIEGAAP